MALIEYSLFDGTFSLTSYSKGVKDKASFRFIGKCCKGLEIGKKYFGSENGVITVKVKDLDEGEYIPVAHTEDGMTICDKIKVAAGVIEPSISNFHRINTLTKNAIMTDERLKLCERMLTELSDTVYGKSIL